MPDAPFGLCKRHQTPLYAPKRCTACNRERNARARARHRDAYNAMQRLYHARTRATYNAQALASYHRRKVLCVCGEPLKGVKLTTGKRHNWFCSQACRSRVVYAFARSIPADLLANLLKEGAANG